MSGICAIRHDEWPQDRVTELLGLVAQGLALPNAPERLTCRTDAGAGVGVSSCFDSQQACETPRVLLACDADLCNEADLRREVEAGTGTAQLLAALYERFGCAFVERLRGAFSVVIWDRRERRFMAAVDPFGIHRLAWYRNARMLMVASRLDALIGSGKIDRQLNWQGIANILNFSSNRAPGTIFSRLQWLLPGTRLILAGGAERVEQYWDMRYGVGGGISEDELSRRLEAVVEESVLAHCPTGSFGHTGAFLSGGTDSSTVVGMMTRKGAGRVKTFSIGFQEEFFNELGYAQITANRFHTDHHTYLVSPEDCREALPHMVRSFDEPFANSSAIPTYFCARLAAQHGVQVLLAGDGGDELFGGNEWYRTENIYHAYQKLPRALRKGLIEPALEHIPVRGGLVDRARRYIRRSNLPGVERVLSFHFLCSHSPADIFEPDFLHALGDYSVVDVEARYYCEAPAHDHLDRLLYLDVKTTLADSDLPKVTKMSELAGIQARFPLLDKLVAEFSGTIPARLKVKGLEKRYLFKRAFRNLLPPEVLKKKKHGFGIPVATWLKTDPRLREMSRDVLFSTRSLERGYFRRKFIEELFRLHEADESTYYGDTLWTFLVLELWHQQAVDAPVGAAA